MKYEGDLKCNAVLKLGVEIIGKQTSISKSILNKYNFFHHLPTFGFLIQISIRSIRERLSILGKQNMANQQTKHGKLNVISIIVKSPNEKIHTLNKIKIYTCRYYLPLCTSNIVKRKLFLIFII